MLSLALAALLIQPAPPMTVNDQVLGRAEDFATVGPARVCLERTSIDILAGETAYLDYLGIHWGAIRVQGPHGTFTVREGDSWAQPTSNFRPMRQTPDLEIERHRQGNRSRYLYYGRSEYGERGTRPVVWLEGGALSGSSRDLRIIRRIDINQRDMDSCRRRFDYGWDFLAGDSE